MMMTAVRKEGVGRKWLRAVADTQERDPTQRRSCTCDKGVWMSVCMY